MFVTNWISTTKIQKISEITNFFRHYFLSRTEVIDALHGYERISCLLDNDEAGRKATHAIETALGYRVRDASHLYSEYNDLNDYLCRVKSKQSVHQVQPVKRTVPPRKRGAALGM